MTKADVAEKCWRARLAFVAALLLSLQACSINPVTGERELTLISPTEAIALGKQSAAQVKQSVGLVDDPDVQAYVARIGHKLAADTERPDLPWAFHVVDNPTPNAFALPGGFIFVTRGLMDLMTSEAQLAAVLGHEIGHVTARHAVVQMSRQKLAQLGLGIGMIASPEIAQYGQLASQGLGLLFLKYSRDDERQADALGFRYMVNEGYDPHQMAQVFEALHRSTALTGGGSLPGWMASHPSDPERIANAKKRLAALPAAERHGEVGRSAYLSHLNGLLYGTDPRNGFFRGDWFYQPTLAFQIRVPENWKRQNLTQSVEGVSPKSDAAVQLTIAKAASPVAAARKFKAQQGIVIISSRQTKLDGNPAIVVEFGAATQNGPVQGYASWVSHQNTTYALLAFSPQTAFAAQQDALLGVATSFKDITQAAILDVKPERIKIVKLPSAMTLKQFNERYPSTIGLDELGVINQVEDANTTLAAGTLMKQVTRG